MEPASFGPSGSHAPASAGAPESSPFGAPPSAIGTGEAAQQGTAQLAPGSGRLHVRSTPPCTYFTPSSQPGPGTKVGGTVLAPTSSTAETWKSVHGLSEPGWRTSKSPRGEGVRV